MVEGEEKNCPRCAETVKQAARVCRYCGHDFERETRRSDPTNRLLVKLIGVSVVVLIGLSIMLAAKTSYEESISELYTAVDTYGGASGLTRSSAEELAQTMAKNGGMSVREARHAIAQSLRTSGKVR